METWILIRNASVEKFDFFNWIHLLSGAMFIVFIRIISVRSMLYSNCFGEMTTMYTHSSVFY